MPYATPRTVMVQCTEGHLFCLRCLGQFAQTRLFEEQRTTLPCMTSGGVRYVHVSMDVTGRVCV